MRVLRELGVRDAGGLEVVPVELAAEQLAHRLQRRNRTALRRRDAEAHDPPDDIGPHQRGGPGDHAAQVVADDHGLLCAQFADQADGVADEVQDGVFLNRGWPVAAGVTALVNGDDVVSGPGQGRELVAPVVPAFGKAVEQENQGSFTPPRCAADALQP